MTEPAEYFKQNDLPITNLVALEKRSVNLVFMTDAHVLRVSRPELLAYVDHEREAELGLKALAHGVKTARPIAWAKTYSIWERLDGFPLTQPEAAPSELWSDLLDTLELLHQNPLEPLQQPAPEPWTGEASHIDTTQKAANWSESERALLYQHLTQPHPVTSPCFIHGDAYADNIIVDADGRFLGLIDWGNAGWHSLEAECASLEDGALELALKRWHGSLDIALLWKMRLNLSLEVTSYGRLPFSAVRAVLEKLKAL